MQSKTIFKEFAWNQIRFKAPLDWNIAEISSSYLLLEDKTGPVMEIKWSQIKGKFSAKNQMRQLAALKNKHLPEPVREYPVPSDWQALLKNFNSTYFSWKGYNIGAKGLILFCSSCKKLILLQFYNRNSDNNSDNETIIYPSILASFSDHKINNNQILWSIFDIRFKLDEKFQLISHKFEPGEFELNFSAKNQKICLYRWSPASIILNNISLLDFAKKRFNLLQKKDIFSELEKKDIIKWKKYFSKNPYLNWFRGLIGQPVISKYCIWHLSDKNRILGVKIESTKINIKKDFDKICSGYECI